MEGLENGLWSLGGGVLIGLSAAALLLLNGRVAGVAGILGGAVTGPRAERKWRLAFLLGLFGGALLMVSVLPSAFDFSGLPSWPWLLVGGLLVGAGTRIGSGCTSGHGVCGVARLSVRSLTATAVFMAAGMTVVWMVRHAWGGG